MSRSATQEIRKERTPTRLKPPKLTQYQTELQQAGWRDELGVNVNPMFRKLPSLPRGLVTIAEPVQVFSALIPDQLSTLWLDEVRHARLLLRNIPSKNLAKQWDPVHIRSYMGMFFFIEAARPPTLDQIFSGNHRPHLSKWMSKERFFFVRQHPPGRLHHAADLISQQLQSHIAMGTIHNYDELHTAFLGESPVATFEPRKPHPLGHNILLAGTKLHTGKSFVWAISLRLPDEPEQTPLKTFRDFHRSSFRDHRPLVTADGWYNSRDARVFVQQQGYFYLLGGSIARERALFGVLCHEIPPNTTRTKSRQATHELASVFNQEGTMLKVMTNGFVPTHTPQGQQANQNRPQLPPLMEEYRSSFNIVDKFNRDFFLTYWTYSHSFWQEDLWDSLLHIMMVDAWVLFCALRDENRMEFRDFIHSVANSLLE